MGFICFFQAEAQEALQTLSGQNIILYSDGTWEYNLNSTENINSPSEKPLNSGDNEQSLSEKLYAFLKKAEVESMIHYLKSKTAEESKLNLEVYQEISRDLIQLSTTEDIKELVSKYLDQLTAKKEISYDMPTVSGKKIKEELHCKIFNENDPQTGDIITRSDTTQILTYTPKKLLNYYKDKIYLSILSCIVERDGDYYLEFELIFNSKDIRKGYGTIPTDGFVRINMIKGPGIFLEITKRAEAKIEKYTGRTIYLLKCKIKNKDDLRRLKKQYVDDLGIMWSTGFEAYPIYDVGFFKEKFKCFESKKQN